VDIPLFAWLCAASGVTFLAVCVRQNRRTGFRRNRSELSLLQEGLIWIESFQFAVEDNPQIRSNAPVASFPMQPMQETLLGSQLVNLAHALADATPPSVANDQELKVNATRR
jgi:hypothetical protein